MTKIKISLDDFNSRFQQAEEVINKLEDKSIDIILFEEQKRKWLKKKKQGFRDLWNDIKHPNIHVTWVPKEERREKRAERMFEEIELPQIDEKH